MAWIEASAAGGGSTGGGNTIMVTCSANFAGLPITCTNGLTTKTLNCPSTAPYVIQFTDIVADEWLISGTVEGTTYSTTVEVGDIFTTTLEAGFKWSTWVDLSLNYNSSSFNSLENVFEDETAVHELMTIHACCDYLIEAVSDDVDIIDDFCANDTAMKWIGLRDYVCDGLTAISGVETKFLASDYWERYLKDHVPTMTSNTSPYGEAFASSSHSSGEGPAWKAFANSQWISASSTTVEGQYLGYKFTNPTRIKKVKFGARSDGIQYAVKTFKVQGSNDGSTWVDVDNTVFDYNDTSVDMEFSLSNDGYYMQCRIYVLTIQSGASSAQAEIARLQFYGRSLNVSVPVMTSNTAPYGEVRSNSTYNPTNDYKPFGHSLSESNSTVYGQISNGVNIDYEFTSRIKPKMLTMKSRVGDYQLLTYKVSGAQDGVFEDIPLTSPSSIVDGYSYIVATLNPSKDYNIIRITPLTTSDNPAHTVAANMYWTAHAIQIYGLDYSEREFEPNSGKKWLYDHGLELETITAYEKTANDHVTKNDDNIYLESVANGAAEIHTPSIDLTNYNLLRVKIGDICSSSQSGATTYGGYGVADSTPAVTGASYVSKRDIAANDLPNNSGLDISSVDVTKPIAYYQASSSYIYKCKIEELWLEQ